MDIDKQLADAITEIKENLVKAAEAEVSAEIAEQLKKIDLKKTVEGVVKHAIIQYIKVNKFPKDSINHSAIDFTGASLTGNIVKGGLIEEFSSTGIDDRANDVQLTILDDATVFENCLVAAGADIKGDVTITGNLEVQGDIVNSALFSSLVTLATSRVQEGLNDELFEGFGKIVHEQITKDGIDLNKVLFDGRTLVKENKLGYHITDSNLQRVGIVKDLQTSGETFLCSTMMVNNKRVGINTMDPSATLSVWDEEVELVMKKKQKDIGYIGTQRQQMLIVGANSKDNIVLHDDGAVTIQSLIVGKAKMSSTEKTPTHDAPKGVILWNENPELGAPVGWVSLGGAKWCSFGWLE